MSRGPFIPGAWREVDFHPRQDRGYPVVLPKHEPVAPHTRWYGAGVCNSFCCGVSVGIVTSSVPNQTRCLEPLPSPDGEFVLELSEHRTSMAVPYDPAIHAGWKRYAAHVCEPKAAKR